MITQYLEVYLRYSVDKLYRLVVFPDTFFGDDELSIGKEYRVVGLSGAVGEIAVWSMQDGVVFALTYAYGFAADITLPDNTAPQNMLKAA